jgi:catechol 2,3-dioxygenase-like lactoylglutathione lyase family enzyme
MKAVSIIEAQRLVMRITVADLQQSVAWYEEKLGCKVVECFEAFVGLEMPGLPHITIGLKGVDPARARGSGGAVLTFVIENIQETHRQLTQRGVAVQPIETQPEGVQLAFFEDLDKNRFALRQDPD